MKTKAVRFNKVVPQFRVRDVIRTSEYYRDALGFETAGYWNGQAVHFDPARPTVFGIVKRDEVHVFFSRAEDPDERKGAVDTSYDAYFDVVGVDALAGDLRARGVEILDGPEDRTYGQRELVVRDCNGMILAFGEDTTRPAG
jgi:uncharacterized glyoxalase superfamily protein PhnB